MLAGLAAYMAGRKSDLARDAVAISAVALVSAAALVLALHYRGLELRLVDFGAFALHFRTDGFRVLYACVAAFLWLATSVFSAEYFSHSKRTSRYWLFNLITFGAVMGIFFSADFRTAFLFFEIMALTSYALVAHDESPSSLRAAETYLTVSLLCGLVQLMGMWILQMRVGTLEFARLYEMSMAMPDKSLFYLPGALLIVGFGAKAGMYPLHIWLPKAHPVAPAPASALLSGILTKTGVFGVAVVSVNIFMGDQGWGVALLVPAVITMVLGAVLGIFSNDLKRTLACSSVSQIGFILTGVAMQVLLGYYNTVAVHGTLLHMLNHSLFKLLLFVAAGVVYINRHELGLNKIRGFGRGKPLFLAVFLMAALGITGVPLWSGYVSKTLLKSSISQGYYLFQGLPLEYLLRFSYWALVVTGGLTFAYMTKLFVTLFVERGESTGESAKEEKRYISRPSALVLVVSAALVPLLGSFTWIMDELAGFGAAFFHAPASAYAMSYFTQTYVRGAMISIAIGAGVYLLVVRGLLMRRGAHVDALPVWLDLENLVFRPCLAFLVQKPVLILQFAASLPATLVRLALNLTVGGLRGIPGALNKSLGRRSRQLLWLFVMIRRDFRRRQRLLQRKSVMAGNFNMDLLFVGAGICVALVYVFVQAFG